MQVTLNIKGDEPLPTVESVIDSMTDDDKRRLAMDIAAEYFKKDVEKRSASQHFGAYGYSGADRYIEQLYSLFKGIVAAEIKRSPELTETVNRTVAAVAGNWKALVQQAVLSFFATECISALNDIAESKQNIDNLKSSLESLSRES